MARRHAHEEHVNHEAWAIPYGDLITLLLAFFVVMYAISSVNEGKYRVVADSLNAAFGGAPRTVVPVQLGTQQLRGSSFDRPSLRTSGAAGPARTAIVHVPDLHQPLDPAAAQAQRERTARQLQSIGTRIQDALAGLVDQNLVRVRQGTDYLEIEIQSDILFHSGSDAPSALAVDTVRRLGAVLRTTQMVERSRPGAHAPGPGPDRAAWRRGAPAWPVPAAPGRRAGARPATGAPARATTRRAR